MISVTGWLTLHYIKLSGGWFWQFGCHEAIITF